MLTWLEADSAHYWWAAWTCFAILGLAALGPTATGLFSSTLEDRCLRIFPSWLYLSVAALSLAAFRWPAWRVRNELNPDESQLIAGAITLQHDPIYWRAVDGTTHGPLDVYPLYLGHWLGLPLNYWGARVLGTALMFLLFFACYRLLAKFNREAVARAAVLPLFCFLAFNSYWDLVHYSSEHVPATLIAIGVWFLVGELARPRERRAWSRRWALGSVALGAVPFAKLQGGPIAAGMLVAIGLSDLCLGGVDFSVRLRRLTTCIVGTLLTAAVFGLLMWWCGSWNDAWRSYIVQNVRYSGDKHHPALELLRGFWGFAQMGEGFYPFALGCSVIVMFSIFRVFTARVGALRLIGFSIFLLAASLYAVLAPGRLYGHYLLFLAAPGGLAAGSLWLACWGNPESDGNRKWDRVMLFFAFCAIAIVPQIADRITRANPFVAERAASHATLDNPVAIEILRHAKPGESLAVWGWMSRFYVYTGMTQATRESHTVQQIQSSPQMAYFRARYIDDLKRSNPPIFVDAVGPGNFVFEDRSLAHESFLELRDYIGARYRQVAEIEGCRIYVRLDRLKGT